MRLPRRFAIVPSLILAALLCVPPGVPMSTMAAEPSLGDAVSLPDGTVLPPMPPEMVKPSVLAEMLAEHGSLDSMDAGGTVAAVEPDAQGGVQAAEPLLVAQGGIVGPGGSLPNGLNAEVFGFLPYWKLDAATRAALRLDLLSTIAYFGISAQSDGLLARGVSVGWQGWISPALTEVINAAHARGVRVVPTVTFMSWDGDYTALSTLLNTPANRGRLVTEIATIVRDRGADGVNIDFEPVPASLRSQFTTFTREVKAGLVAAGVGSFVTVSTMAGAATWSTGYDVVGLTAAGAADALMVMAYDFSWSGSARAGAVAPIESDHIFASADAMRDHLSRVPGSKLIWGVPYYGRAWNTTSDALNATIRSPAQSVAFSYYWTDAGAPAGGKVLAARFGRRWDAAGQVPYFAFWDAGSNGYRQGYYDDPVSLRAKYDMVQANGVAGVGIWHLGMDTGVPELWDLLADRFRGRVTRIGGADRYATAAAVSASTYAPGVPTVFVATGADFPDALAAGPLAARAGGPVLLTTPDWLPSATVGELLRLRPQRIVVLGGAGAVSDGVVAALGSYAVSGEVQRISGADRYATAAGASAATFPAGVPVAYVATGTNFPDALTGGVAASREGGPVLLVTPTSVPGQTATELARLQPGRIVVLGGTGAVSDDVLGALRTYATTGNVTRLAGANRYDTAVAISQATNGSQGARTVYVATGDGFADGLAGTPVAARAGGPLLIIPPHGLTQGVALELLRLNPSHVVILGGTGAVSSATAAQLAGLWD